MKEIGAVVIAEDIPHHGPPALRPKKARDLRKGVVFFEPMKGRGADTKIKARLIQRRILKGRDRHLKCFVRIVLAKIGGKARVRFDRDERVCAEIEQPARRYPRAWPD